MASPHPFLPGAECMAVRADLAVKPRVRVPAVTMRTARPVEPDLAGIVAQLEDLTDKIRAAAA